MKSTRNGIELVTRPGHVFSLEKASKAAKEGSKKLADGMGNMRHAMDMPCFDTSESNLNKLEANLHSMTRYELLQVQRKTREEKKLYR